jgi:DNA-binding SARP family transcriptional activator
LVWAAVALAVVLAVVGSVLNVIGRPRSTDLDYEVVFFVGFLAFTLVGAFVASRRPANPIGWLLVVSGLLWELAGVLAGYANEALFARPDSLPGGTFAAWVVSWLWIPTLVVLPLVFVLFPDGRVRSPWGRPIMWLAAGAGLAALVGRSLAPGPMANAAAVVNPYGVSGGKHVLSGLEAAGTLALATAMAAAIVSLILRYRRAGTHERQQIKWLAFAGGLVAVAFTVGQALDSVDRRALGDDIRVPSLLLIPVAIAVAILHDHLYDIDVVISRSVVFGGLAVFITAVYLAVVVGIGTAVGSRAGSNLALAVVATALVAVGFQPLRQRLQRLARRVVFGAPSGAEMTAGVAIYCLGAFRVFRDGSLVPLTAWQSRKARTLLKVLVARRGRSTARELLMDILWPDEEPSVVSRRLSVALATVRAVLDPAKQHPPDHFIVGDRDAVRLDLSHLPIDVERFLTVAAEGLAAARGTPETRRVLTSAVQLYGGDFLEEDPYEDWAMPLREEARASYIAAARALAAAEAATGRVDEASRRYLQVLEKDPWDEDAHLALVRMLAAAGRHGQARRCYSAYAARMAEIRVPVAPFPSPTSA